MDGLTGLGIGLVVLVLVLAWARLVTQALTRTRTHAYAHARAHTWHVDHEQRAFEELGHRLHAQRIRAEARRRAYLEERVEESA